MAVKYEEVDILGEGIQYSEPTKGNFALNMLLRQGAWEVRQGFGQMAEFDCLMPFSLNSDVGGDPNDWGYRKHLGSHVIRTDFGHTQIISVLRAKVYTDEASQPESSGRDTTYSAEVQNIFLVSIYDVTTNERWEEPLYGRTSEGGVTNQDLEFRHGNYQTSLERDCQSWVAWQDDDPFFFAEVGDIVYFGSKSVPLYAYSPCTFRGNRHQQVASFRDGHNGDGTFSAAPFGAWGGRPDWVKPYSESGLVWRVQPSEGAFPETFTYRTSSNLPQPEALLAFDGALVIANQRVLYFSDIFAPTVYIDQNVVVVPTEKEITALGRSGQNIYIFTESETWVFAPGQSDLMAESTAPVRVSDTIGCVSQSALTNFGEALIWVSLRGVHIASGGLEVQTISGPIEPLFTDFITDPCTTFFTATTANTGAVNPNEGAIPSPQRNSVITKEGGMVNATYCDHLGALLITLPLQNAALCFSGDQWSLWTFESNTGQKSQAYAGGSGQVPNAIKNIANPWLLSIDDSLFCVGGVQTEAMNDYSPQNDDISASSYYILEYGRGGAVDRSVDGEDYRMVAGKYQIYWYGTPWSSIYQNSRVVFDKWIPVGPGYKFWGGGAASGGYATAPTGEYSTNAPEVTFLVPIKLVPSHTAYDPIHIDAKHGIEKIEIRFRFDNTYWEPVFANSTTSTEVELLLPPERMSSYKSWSTRTCNNSASGYAASRAGDTIILTWDGTSGVAWQGGGNFKPVTNTSGGMNLPVYRESLLCFVAMKTKASQPFPRGVATMNITPDAGNAMCTVYNNLTSATSSNFTAYVWQQWARFPRHAPDIDGDGNPTIEPSVTQAVDWAYLGPDVALNSDTRLKLRGLAVTLLSHGQGTDKVNAWSQGIFNMMFAADLKSWMTQVVDYVGGVTTFRRPVSVKTNLYPTPREDGTIRDRIPSATPGQRAEFSAGAVYGKPAASETTPAFESNTCLIGDEQVDTVVTSDSVKGTTVTAMLFGFMRNPAERLKLQSVKALVRTVGASRRRKGR